MHRLYLKLQIAFWGLVFLALFVPHRIAGDLQGWIERDLVGGLLFSGVGVFVSHLCYRGLLGGYRGERVPTADPGALRWALSAAAIAAALLTPGMITQSLQLGPLNVPELTLSESLRLYLAARSGDAATIALGWLLGCSALFALNRAHAADTHRLAAQLEMERQSALASEARLAALHARVQPHFLFNAMNSIRALIVEQPDVARQAVTDLAYLMRQTLNAAEASEHTIEDELRIVEAYLNLEKLRFAARLRWRYAIAKNAAGLRLPPLLLQTLVENAVKHGVGRRSAAVEIALAIRLEGGRACIEVKNTGTLPEPIGSGSGLTLSRERLRLLYGDDSAVSLRQEGEAVLVSAEWRPRSDAAAASVRTSVWNATDAQTEAAP